MLLDVFKESQPMMKYNEIILDPERYLKLTDATIFALEHREESEFAKTKELIGRINSRGPEDVYHMIN